VTEPLESTMKAYLDKDQWHLYKDRFEYWRGIVGKMTIDEALTKLPGWEEVLGLTTLMHILIDQELRKGDIDV